MKKFILLIGVVAMFAACTGQKASKETEKEEATEMSMEAEAPVDTMSMAADSMEVVADSTAVDTTMMAE